MKHLPAKARDKVERLSAHDRSLRDSCVERVKRGMIGLAEAADALRELRDARLYRETHKTFEAFCRDQFGLTRKSVYAKIAAAEVMQQLEMHRRPEHLKSAAPGASFVTPGVTNPPDNETDFGTSDVPNDKPGFPFLPQNESQLIELSAVPEARMPHVWTRCIEAAGGRQPDKRQVRKVVAEALGRSSAGSEPGHSPREAVRRAVAFLRLISSPSENISAAIDLLTKELDDGASKPAKKKGKL